MSEESNVVSRGVGSQAMIPIKGAKLLMSKIGYNF